MFKENCIGFKTFGAHHFSFYPIPWSDRLYVYSLRPSWKVVPALEKGLEASAATPKNLAVSPLHLLNLLGCPIKVIMGTRILRWLSLHLQENNPG